MILENILAGATLGGIIGESIATIAGTEGADVLIATATGTLVGAVGGVVVGVSEQVSNKRLY